MSEFELWYQKHRPKTFDDYVWSGEGLKKEVTDWLRDPVHMPHIILEGPYGTGKTTLALLIVDGLSLEPSDWLYIDTNKHGGVDSIRDDVTNFCELGGWSGIKVVIIDEADGLSLDAQEKLRSVFNAYGGYVRFIFTCNKIRAINDGLKSRSVVVSIKQMDEEDFAVRLIDILTAEKIELPDEDVLISGIEQIVKAHYPDMRKAIGTLQRCCISGKFDINAIVGNVLAPAWESSLIDTIMKGAPPSEIREITTSLNRNEFEDAYRFLYENATDMFDGEAKQMVAIIQIADALYRHANVSFPDINLAALLIELVKLQQE